MRGQEGKFRSRLLNWYERNRRDLPWRLPMSAPRDARLDPYHVLVSELMLQQTQVSTVVPYFHRFIARFPTVQALAGADEQEVLRLWQGLGYYSRARNLHAAAKKVVNEFHGRFPRAAQELRGLPGVGRYTAGAIASIAFDEPAPAVDGNVARVLCRLHGHESETQDEWWTCAGKLVIGPRPGDFNSAMMELGATVCTPKAPKCLLCPVAEHCEALAGGMQEKLPRAKERKITPLERRDVICVQHNDRWLIEQRPAKGRWASMWQFVTLPRNGKPLDGAHVREAVGHQVGSLQKRATLKHTLTHRRYEFHVFIGAASRRSRKDDAGRVWVTLEQLQQFPMSRPQSRIAQLLASEKTDFS